MDKLDHLKTLIRNYKSAIIAFSGGVDSTFLTKVCFDELGDNAIAVTATSSTYPVHELEQAKDLAKKIGIKHIIIKSEELDIPEFKSNPKDRCYFCKLELFNKINELAKENSINKVIEGSTIDDLDDFRPGRKAIKELNIKSPLLDAELTKDEIRKYSKEMNLPTWNKGSFACLSSRFPYGTEITKDRLEKVGKAEDLLREIGFKQFRVRYHNEVARIEILPGNFPKLIENRLKIVGEFRKLGFLYVTMDLLGYRTGSMNEKLVAGR